MTNSPMPDREALLDYHRAVCAGQIDDVKAYLDTFGNEAVDLELPLPSSRLRTALHEAAAYVRSEMPAIIRLLIARGADPDSVDAVNLTPLMRAVLAYNFDNMRALLEAGANPAPRHPDALIEETPLLEAIATKNTEAIALLLEYGAPLDEEGNGQDPVIFARECRHFSCARLLTLEKKRRAAEKEDAARALDLPHQGTTRPISRVKPITFRSRKPGSSP